MSRSLLPVMSVKPPGTRRCLTRLTRGAVIVSAVAAVLLACVGQPLSQASAATRTPPRGPTVSRGLVKLPPGAGHDGKIAIFAHAPHRAARPAPRRPLPEEKTGSYLVSPTVIAFLDQGLGLRLGGSRLLTGVRSDNALKITTANPPHLRLGLPSGFRAPSFGPATLTVNEASGTVTVAASAAQASLKVRIAHAATATLADGTGLASSVTLRLPLFGRTVSLDGGIGYAAGSATVSLSGGLPAAAALAPGEVSLDGGTLVTLSTAGGLYVSGSGSLGPPGHQLKVTLSGRLAAREDWSLSAGPRGTAPAALLPGLSLAPGFTGTVTDSDGSVGFTVNGRTARAWAPGAGVSLTAGTITFKNFIQNGRGVVAPGIAPHTPWLAVTGLFSVGSGQAGTVAANGTMAVNLASGGAIFTAAGTIPARLRAGPRAVTLDKATFGGLLKAAGVHLVGAINGTGRVTMWTATGKTVMADARLAVTSAGTLTANLPPGLSETAPGRAARATTRPAAETAGTTSYTLSDGVYNFITNTLGIQLGSSTVTGTLSGETLTLTAGPPGALPLSLPTEVPALTFGSTAVSIDEAANTITLNSSATSSGGVTGSLQVTIANASSAAMTDGSDLTSAFTIDNLPFPGGSTVTLTGALGYAGGQLTASATVTLGTALTVGAVTLQPGTTLTLATGTGLSVNGAVQIGTGESALTLNISGVLTSLNNWTLTVSSTGYWEPLPSLSVYPDFSGELTGTADAVSFDLTTSQTVTWTPGTGATVTLSTLELSDETPGDQCSSTVSGGDLWFYAEGTFAYAPAGITIGASTCANLSSQSYEISTQATGDLTGAFGSSLFSVTSARLTAEGDATGSFQVSGTATLLATGVSDQPSSQPSVQVAVGFINGDIVAGGTADLGDFSNALSGSGTVYVSSGEIDNFNPSKVGVQGAPSFDLPQGLALTLDYPVPSNVLGLLGDIGITSANLPNGATSQAIATLSTSGFSMNLSLDLGTQADGAPVIDEQGTQFYLDNIGVSFALGATSGVSVSGTGFLELPPLLQGDSGSQAGVTLTGSVSASGAVSFAVTLSNVQNAFGIAGLDASDMFVQIGVSGDIPTLGFSATGLTLPANLEQAIGMSTAASISFAGEFSPSNPVLQIAINGTNGLPALTPLEVVSTQSDPLSPSVVNSLTVENASVYIAPSDGTIGGVSYPQGISVAFVASIDGVDANIEASVDPSALSLSGSASLSSFYIGPVAVTSPTVGLDLSPDNLGLTVSGNLSTDGFQASTSISLAAGSTENGANISLSVTGGVPASLSQYNVTGFTASLSGSISDSGTDSAGGSNGLASFTASGTGTLYAAGGSLGPVAFTLAAPGSLGWYDAANNVYQIAQFFYDDAGDSVSQVIQILQGFGFSPSVILSALDEAGASSVDALNSVENFFYGLVNPSSFYIWFQPPVSQFPYILPEVVEIRSISSTAPGQGADTAMWTGDGNQVWSFVEGPVPGWWNIVNEGSGLCLTAGSNIGDELYQDTCDGSYGQLWWLGSQIKYWNGQETIASVEQTLENGNTGWVMNVTSATPGASVDQWSDTNDWNEEFYFTVG
jgi:Ricin-type beta-trefoil lectin domain-like